MKQISAADLMPQGKDAETVLRMRAEMLAKVKLETKSQDGIAFVRFALSQNEFYGIDYQYVKEVLPKMKPTFLPHAPKFILGVINWRGSLIPALDLKRFFHPEVGRQEGFGIIVKGAEMTLALLVDSIVGSESYQLLSLEPPLASANAALPDFILGIHQGVTAIIRFEALIDALREPI